VTLNLGVRWDLAWNGFAQEVTLAPWMAANRPQDVNNVQPRVGVAYSLNHRTVLRGGGGLYYADVTSPNVQWAESAATIALITANNDGRADFASNPFNGALPGFDQATRLFCYANNNAPGCLIRDLMNWRRRRESWRKSPTAGRPPLAWHGSSGADMSPRGRLRVHGQSQRASHPGQRQRHVRFPQPASR